MHDAEDAMQETLLAAWKGLGGFEARSSIRTWLYRVATSRCLNALQTQRRRDLVSDPMPRGEPPEPTRLAETLWLEPYPDVFLEGLADSAPGPEARYEAREAVSLAFVAALQRLPARQRAVLILRDVLGFHAAEVAGMLESTEESVTSALKRARATLQAGSPGDALPAPPLPNSEAERAVVERFTTAFEAQDVQALVAILTDDVLVTMPPLPLEYQGREAASRFFSAAAAWQTPGPRLFATRANGQPAFGLYVRDSTLGGLRAIGLLVITLAGCRVSAITRFDNSVLDRFGFERTLGG